VSYDVAGSKEEVSGGGLRPLIDGGRATHGGWCMVPGAFATEIVSASGCDWLCVDLQHGLIGDEDMRTMVMAAAIRRTPVFVRVPWNEPAAIMRALDAGADGVIVPMVNTAQEAERAVAASRYPPLGYRSWGPLRSLMSMPGFDPAVGNGHVVCLVMVETVESFENLDAILAVPGVDGVFVGPNDLAISSTGMPTPRASSEKDAAMIRAIADRCRVRGLVAGISCADGEQACELQALGYTLLGLPSDAGLLGKAMTDVLAIARGAPAA
jgi:4-hydroxy-2-oxoheptanedioate aldolase